MSYRHFDRDFKLSAVKLSESSDLPLSQIARSLGIHDSMLRRWRNLVRPVGDFVKVAGEHIAFADNRLFEANLNFTRCRIRGEHQSTPPQTGEK